LSTLFTGLRKIDNFSSDEIMGPSIFEKKGNHYQNTQLSKYLNNLKPNTSMEKEIGKILKGEYQGTLTEIVIGLREFNGRTGVDIREFTKSEQYTGPTKKGLRIPSDKFEEFKSMINSIDPKDLESSSPTEPKEEPKATENEDAGIDEEGLM
jgi:hypothetical protein